MNRQERRFAPRFDAATLKVELQTRNLFGQWRAPHRAIGIDVGLGGLAILTPIKLAIGRQVRMSLGNQSHQLNDVPGRIIRQAERDGDYVYGISFELGPLPEDIRLSAETVLSRVLAALQPTPGAESARDS